MSGHTHSHRHDHDLEELTRRLRNKARKITGPRQAILDLLRQNSHPLTNKEVHAALPDGMCDLASIYRSMHMLEEMGLARRFDFGDGVARFELVGAEEDAHHHHLICTKCTSIVEIDECFQAELERSIAERHGFKAVTHKLEFFGICPGCQTASPG